MIKIKLSHTIDEELVSWLDTEIETKRFSNRSHGIEYALMVLKGIGNQPTNPVKPAPVKNDITEAPEIITESSLSLEVMRNKWWKDKQIGISIIKAGGIGVINLTNIIQKNPDLFETKEECRTWLHNKLKTEPPVIEEIETIKTLNKSHKGTALKAAPANTESVPSFIPRRSTIKCPGCGEEQLELPGSPVRKCANCGFNFNQTDSTKPQSDQIMPAQKTPTPPPEET